MQTLIKSTIWIRLFLGILFLLVTTSCSGTATPSERATLPAGYVRFHPEQGALFEIEFDHPENWVLRPDPSNKLDTFLIYDPTGQLPSSGTKFQPYEPIKWGRIYITVYQVSNPVEEMNKIIALTEKWENKPLPDEITRITAQSQSEILENLTGEIDGTHSRQLTSRITVDWKGDKYLEINRMFLFVKGDRLYLFELSIPEKDSNNDFAKAFDYMIASIRFIR